MFLQREIYDRRYAGSGYDNRSAVHVLSSEMSSLKNTVSRAIRSLQCDDLSLLDFGYGTGRITNDFVLEYPLENPELKKITLIAYDVSSLGLRKGVRELVRRSGGDLEATIEPSFNFRFMQILGGTDQSNDHRASESKPNIIEKVVGKIHNCEIECIFVLGNETDSPAATKSQIISANHGRKLAVTSSWYSSVGHVPTNSLRKSIFKMLGELTDESGEIVISVSSSGDLVEAQKEWYKMLQKGQTNGLPIETRGDTVYETEIIGLWNYYHVFGTDLTDHLNQMITADNQRWWIEGIRLPDEEFQSREEEQDNYRMTSAFNQTMHGRTWQPYDYSTFHTVAGFRSALPEE